MTADVMSHSFLGIPEDLFAVSQLCEQPLWTFAKYHNGRKHRNRTRMDTFLAKKNAQSSQKDVHHSENAETPMTSEF